MTSKEEKAVPAAGKAELLTPAEWGARKGLVSKLDPVRPWEPPHKQPAYAAADMLHGWTQDAYDYQAEADQLRISEADFDKALEAAGGYPANPAHGPACGRRFKDRAKPVIDPHTKRELQAVKSDG